MKKILMLLMLFILLQPLVSAIQIQHSEDNITWENVTSIDQTKKEALQDYIQFDEIHYFRGRRTASSTWEYVSTPTANLFDDRMIAIIFGLTIVGIFFFVLGLMSKGLGIKIFCFGMTLIQVINMVFLLYLNEMRENLIPLLKINFVVIFLMGGLISLIVLMIYLINSFNSTDAGTEPGEKWMGGGKWQ